MHSSTCKNFDCQHPLQVRNVHTGQVAEVLTWDWSQGLPEQVAVLLPDGARIAASALALNWELVACEHCGQEQPAQDWPSSFGPAARGLHEQGLSHGRLFSQPRICGNLAHRPY